MLHRIILKKPTALYGRLVVIIHIPLFHIHQGIDTLVMITLLQGMFIRQPINTERK